MRIIAADLIQIGNDRDLLRHGLWYGLLILCVLNCLSNKNVDI
jgi:hypothetical protein